MRLFWVVVSLALVGCGGGPSMPCRVGDASACRSACRDKGEGRSCTMLGVTYEKGINTSADEKAAFESYTRGCLTGDGEGCHLAGLKLLLGRGVKQNNEMATRMFEAACQFGVPDGCAMNAALRAATPGASRMDTAKQLQLACNGDSAIGCALLADRYMNGDGVGVDAAAALELYKRACHLGDADSCAQSGATPAK